MKKYLSSYPELVKEWHPTKNGDLKADQVVAGSRKKIWWQCNKEEDHEWEAQLRSRARGNNCPFCYGRFADSKNNLKIKFPKIANEWHPIKNGDVTPEMIKPQSSFKAWWQCKKNSDHIWLTGVCNRIADKTGCPYCSRKLVSYNESLAVTHPKLAQEWHPVKNGNLTPSNVLSGSSKKIWWRCNKNFEHVWESTLNKRSSGRGCPSCAEYGFDRSEDALFYLRKISLKNGKQALKFGITNNMDGEREKQQKRHVEGSVNTILREKVSGENALDIENLCKKHFGRRGYLTAQEFPDGHTETIQYSEENLNNIKLIVYKVLNDKRR